MESFMKTFTSALLLNGSLDRCQNCDDASALQDIIIRGNSDHSCNGDIILPLKSTKLSNSTSNDHSCSLYAYIKDPQETSLQHMKEILNSTNVPVEKVCMKNNLLCFTLIRKEMIQLSMRRILKDGKDYGRSKMLHSKKVTIIHDTSHLVTSPINVYRGHTVLIHVMKMCQFLEADALSVDYNKKILEAQSHSCEVDTHKSEFSASNENNMAAEPSRNNDEITLWLKCSGKSAIKEGTECGTVLSYKHLISDGTGKAWRVSADVFFKLCLDELRHAMELKFGEISTEEGSQFLHQQALQCMTLHLLSKNYSDDIRVHVGESKQNTKDWVFILYNYARLKMIFKAFEAKVLEDELKPLPIVEDVDFSLLKNDEEWILIWEYVIRWPEIVEEFGSTLLKNPARVKTSFIVKFLHALSHHFSVYYRRYRVLVSGEFPHLMPLMFARLYFLKSLMMVMDICFSLIGIDSPPESTEFPLSTVRRYKGKETEPALDCQYKGKTCVVIYTS